MLHWEHHVHLTRQQTQLLPSAEGEGELEGADGRSEDDDEALYQAAAAAATALDQPAVQPLANGTRDAGAIQASHPGGHEIDDDFASQSSSDGELDRASSFSSGDEEDRQTSEDEPSDESAAGEP